MLHKGKTNYKNSIVNFAASLRKYYNLPTSYPTHALIDFLLSRKYKHVAVILLDGMGIEVIDNNLGNGSILKTHQIMTLNSVYPTTTVAATTALIDGRAPIESGWLGWGLYFNEEDPAVTLFQNRILGSEEVFTKYKASDFIPQEKFYTKLKRAKGYEIGPSFFENGCATFNEAITKLKENLTKDETNFTYLYWDQPDGIMHEYGPASQVVRVNLIEIEKQIEQLSDNLPADSIVFIIADHGMVNVEPVNLSNYNVIYDCLRKPIGGEGRFAQFYIKEGREAEFKEVFTNYFGNDFMLYTKQEFIESKLAGLYDIHETTKTTLGDFCAVACGNKYLLNEITADTFLFKGHHGGITKEELEVPVILLKNKEQEVDD